MLALDAFFALESVCFRSTKVGSTAGDFKCKDFVVVCTKTKTKSAAASAFIFDTAADLPSATPRSSLLSPKGCPEQCSVETCMFFVVDVVWPRAGSP